MQNGSKLDVWQRRVSIHTLELKLRHLKVFPYVCIGSHAFAMFLIKRRGVCWQPFTEHCVCWLSMLEGQLFDTWPAVALLRATEKICYSCSDTGPVSPQGRVSETIITFEKCIVGNFLGIQFSWKTCIHSFHFHWLAQSCPLYTVQLFLFRGSKFHG